jgi:mannose-6-phosphate isomerase-like protein (cupin superfamily)
MKINPTEKLSALAEHWSPRLVATVNATDVKLVKLHGEFIWHHHEQEDELFFVLKGRLLMQFRNREEWTKKANSSSCRPALSTARLRPRKCM